uniref:Uncharacterized protein n=1 Tax=Timema poppense TaxID=170557 RepID=A0A7R9DJG1_TIMPO|nr:unnamed protein product [Timema poppensis]
MYYYNCFYTILRAPGLFENINEYHVLKLAAAISLNCVSGGGSGNYTPSRLQLFSSWVWFSFRVESRNRDRFSSWSGGVERGDQCIPTRELEFNRADASSRCGPRVDAKPCSPVDSLRSSAATEHGGRDGTPVYVSERAMREYNLRLDLAAFFLAEQAIPSIDGDLVLRECGLRVHTMPCSIGEQIISSKVSEQVESDHGTCVDGMNHFLEEHKILSGRVEQLVIDLLLQIIWKAVLFSEEENMAEVHNNTKIDKIINDLQSLKINSWSQSNLDVKCSRESLPDTEVEAFSLSDEKINKIAIENSATFPQESNDDNGDQEGLGECNNLKIGDPKIYERENSTSAPCEPPINTQSDIKHINNAMTSSNDDEEDSEVEVQIIEPTYNDSADESDTEFESYRNEKALFIKGRKKELWTCAGLLVEDRLDPFSLSQDIFELNSFDHISDASFEDFIFKRNIASEVHRDEIKIGFQRTLFEEWYTTGVRGLTWELEEGVGVASYEKSAGTQS